MEPKHPSFSGDNLLFYDDDHYPVSSSCYKVLSEVNVRQLMENDISKLQTVFSISRSAAIILLFHHKWDIDRFADSWVAHEDAVFTKFGIFDKGKPKRLRYLGDDDENAGFEFDMSVICAICTESFDYDDSIIYSASCGHPFCKYCWGKYIRNSIGSKTGYEILTLKCPEPSCNAVVGEELFDELCSIDEDRKKYWGFLVKSYLEQSRDVKWCPNPNCGHLVSLIQRKNGFKGSPSLDCEDVACVCLHKFCWDCLEESHHPVDCVTAAKWVTRSNDGSANLDWIAAYTKACPDCNQLIQKDGGCIHMVCYCGFEFCWICLGGWGKHENDDDLARCYENYYHGRGEEGGDNDCDGEGWIREELQERLERHGYYYKGWEGNDLLLKIDMEILRNHSGDMFLKDAWRCIVDSRRILKWSYVYGYYMLANEEVDFKRKNYFEYLQDKAASRLEQLYDLVTRVETSYLLMQKDVIQMTRSTEEFFKSFVKSLESGLPEVEPHSWSGSSSGINDDTTNACSARN